MFNNKKRPIIGIPTDTVIKNKAQRHWLRDSYVSAIIEAGGAPLLIPSVQNEDVLAAIYTTLDGLLLTGGGDIDPKHYQESVNGTEMNGIQPHRDYAEITLTKWALRDDLPILGICRGQQLINVVLGGTLHQDIPSVIEDKSHDHRGSNHTPDRSVHAHDVRFEEGCKLAAVFGTETFKVNSLHHQAINRVGEGLRVIANSPDNVPEAIESTRHRWVVAVQWHPEELRIKETKTAQLFHTFIEAASIKAKEPELSLV